MTTPAALILLITGMVFIPLSVLLAKCHGKRLVYGSGMIILTIVLMIEFAWGQPRPANFFRP